MVSNLNVNLLVLIRGEERYIFIYNDENCAELFRVLGRFASNQELNFTWYDAAVLSQKALQKQSQNQS